MGLSTTLANALTGLNAAARGAEVVSSNVANALTPGYARRELQLSSLALGGAGSGVRVDDVTRAVNRALLADRRLADADMSNASARTGFLKSTEEAIGMPGDSVSLSDAISRLDQALVEAASRPDSEARLQTVVAAFEDIADKLSSTTAMLQQTRMEADRQIQLLTDELNSSLAEVDRLNASILAARSSNRDAGGLMDERQRLVDRIAEIVPVRELQRDHDQIALFTTGGAILLEGNPARIGFTASGVITADRTLAAGDLSGLTVNGQPIQSSDDGQLGGGLLGAQLAIRDELAPAAQANLDALARNLTERFAAPGVDPTLAPGAPGLLTDAGGTFTPANEAGLAGRLAVNAAVDPGQGGAVWRLRDGLGAATPGDAGNAGLLLALKGALDQTSQPASGTFSGAARSASGLAADLLSQVASDRLLSETRGGSIAARQSSLAETLLQDGVDTDAELQNLLMIEQAYSANARVIKTVDDLLQQLIGM